MLSRIKRGTRACTRNSTSKIVLCRRSQITVFVIIAILLVSVLLVVFWPKIENVVFGSAEPEAFMISCVNDKAEESLSLITKRGGSLNPENAIMYQGENVEYLCYTNEYYKTCSNQQPLLKQHIQEELEAELRPVVKQCALTLREDLQRQGYVVALGNTNIGVEIIPSSIVFDIDMDLALTKDTSTTYDSVKFSMDSKLYDLLMISTSILNYEASLGDSDPLTYMLYYPDLKVEKYKQSDGSKIYILTDRITEDQFVFASRSLSWPPGFSTNTV
ncbi:MAG: hypothetical protein ABIE22_01710 [archaeon]